MSKSAEDYIPGLGKSFFISPGHADAQGDAKDYIPGLGTDFTIRGEHLSTEGGGEDYIPGLGKSFKINVRDIKYDSLSKPNAVEGVGRILVISAPYLTTLKLYNDSDVLVDSYTLTGEETSHQFNLPNGGLDHYVIQELNGVASVVSDNVSALPNPLVITGSDGSATIDVTGAVLLSTLSLYDNTDTVAVTYELTGDDTSYQFTGVRVGEGYYVTQTTVTLESPASNVVTVLPAPVVLTGSGDGEATVDAAGATALATVDLYDSADALIDTHILVGEATTHQFTTVTPGLGYYALQTVNGLVSLKSNVVNVAPAPVVATGSVGGVLTVEVAGATELAIVALYDSSRVEVETHVLVGAATTHTFVDVPVGIGYYVRQVVNGASSIDSNIINVA